MTTNFLFTQAPNRKGNASVREASHTTGVTAVTNTKHGLYQPKGAQGAPKAGGNIATRGQKVMVQTNCDYDGKIHNDGYMNSDRTNYLK